MVVGCRESSKDGEDGAWTTDRACSPTPSAMPKVDAPARLDAPPRRLASYRRVCRSSCADRGDDAIESHGLSAFGDLAYPADFQHFSYVDPNAPKGGMFSQIGPDRLYNQNFLTFNSLNSFILKGDAAQGMELTFATLHGALRRRTGRHVWARRRKSAPLGRRPDLSFLHPAGGQIPRRFAADRARC